MDASLWGCSGHFQLERDPGVDQEYAVWSRNTDGYPRKSCRTNWEEGRAGYFALPAANMTCVPVVRHICATCLLIKKKT